MKTIKIFAAIIILKTTLFVLLGYVDYLPPDFQNDFLLGRESYFYGLYSIAFYTHIVAGPLSLVLGVLLISRRALKRFPRWHRRLGRIQAVNVLFLLVPSGLWMARYSMTGVIASLGFATLSLATAFTMAAGWRAAVQRRFHAHQIWMSRCFALLCSAVVLRLFGGAVMVLGWEGTYPFAAWVSWVLPLAFVEWLRHWRSGLASRARQLPQRHPGANHV